MKQSAIVLVVLLYWPAAALAQPTILSFDADPSVIGEGGESTLSWSVSGGDSVTIASIGFSSTLLQGSVQVSPEASTSYLLGLWDQGSMVDAFSVAVVVNSPVISSFTISPSPAGVGELVSIDWSVTGGDSITVQPPGLSSELLDGTFQVPAVETTLYTLSLYHMGNIIETAQQSLTVVPPFIELLDVSDRSINQGDLITLSWNARGGDSVTLDPVGFAGPSGPGSIQDRPLVTTTYVLSLLHESAVVDTRSIQVQVDPAQISSFFASPNPASIGETVSLRWTRAGGDSLTIAPIGFSTAIGTTGTIPIVPTENTTYRADLYLGPDIVDTKSVDLVLVPPIIHQFTASPNPVVLGDPVTLTYNARGGDLVVIEPGGIQLSPGFGNTQVTPTGPTLYELNHFYQGELVGSASVFVTTRLPEILEFSATPNPAVPGGDVQLHWEVTEAIALWVSPPGVLVSGNSGSLTVNPTETTTYTLTLWYHSHQLTADVTVNIVPFIVDFSVTPSVIPLGGSSTLDWVTSLGDSLLIEPLGLASTNPNGSVVVSPSVETDYTLSLFADGAVADQQTVRLTVSDLAIAAFDVQPTQIFAGEPVQTDWNVVSARPVTITLDGEGPLAKAGTRILYPLSNIDMVLEASDGFATVSETRSVQVDDPAPGGEQLRLVRDPVDLEASFDFPVGVPFDVYAVTINPQPAIQGYNFRVEWPPCVVHVATEYLPGAFNATSLPDHVVTIPQCHLTTPVTVLAKFTLFAADTGDPCLDQLHVVTPEPTQVFGGDFGVLPCSGGTTPFDYVVGITLGDPATALPPPEIQWSEDTIVSATPNPFNPRTEIRFTVTQPGEVQLSVFDLAGRLVAGHSQTVAAAGEYRWTWEGQDDGGAPVASGVYFVRLNTAQASDVQKVTLLK